MLRLWCILWCIMGVLRLEALVRCIKALVRYIKALVGVF